VPKENFEREKMVVKFKKEKDPEKKKKKRKKTEEVVEISKPKKMREGSEGMEKPKKIKVKKEKGEKEKKLLKEYELQKDQSKFELQKDWSRCEHQKGWSVSMSASMNSSRKVRISLNSRKIGVTRPVYVTCNMVHHSLGACLTAQDSHGSLNSGDVITL
jgi:hypothetical protein